MLTTRKVANRVSENAKKTLDLVKAFVEEKCIPAGKYLLSLLMPSIRRLTFLDPVFHAQVFTIPTRPQVANS
jgi:hypothetical protein